MKNEVIIVCFPQQASSSSTDKKATNNSELTSFHSNATSVNGVSILRSENGIPFDMPYDAGTLPAATVESLSSARTYLEKSPYDNEQSLPDEQVRAAIQKIINELNSDELESRFEIAALEKFKTAYSRGSNIKIVIDGGNIFQCAVSFSNYDLIKILLENDIDINSADSFGDTPLHLAIQNQSEKLAALLINENANINISNNAGCTPLHIAIINRLKNTVDLLIEKGANIEIEAYKKYTPLALAAMYDNQDILELLMDKGVNINATNSSGMTALQIMAEHFPKSDQSLGMFKLLLQMGADPNIPNESGDTVMHILFNAHNNKHNVASTFKINGIDKKGITIILAKMLIVRGANLNTKNQSGKTPLDLLTVKNCTIKIEINKFQSSHKFKLKYLAIMAVAYHVTFDDIDKLPLPKALKNDLKMKEQLEEIFKPLRDSKGQNKVTTVFN